MQILSSYSRERPNMVGSASIPRMLEALLSEKFFIPCFVHPSERKHEKNILCLDCCVSLCSHCLPLHPTHNLLQIRRYVYRDVIRLRDAQKLLDCSFVQSYITNKAKVVFLNQRPMSRPFKGSGNICIVCERNVQFPFLFCSLSCKVYQLGITKPHLFSSQLKAVKVERSLELKGVQMSPDSVLEVPVSLRTSSSSSVGALELDCAKTLAWTATTTKIAKKKRSTVFVSQAGCSPGAQFSNDVNRRKGVPHRSPLY